MRLARRKTPIEAGASAFTLLEIMIAMMILAILLTAIYACWSSILRGSKVGLEAAAQVQRTRMAMRCLVDSLLSIHMYEANLSYYSFNADTKTDFAYLSFVARLPASFPNSGLYGDQSLRRVTFTVEPGPDRANQLVMYQAPLLLDTSGDQQLKPVVLAQDVSMFSLEFWGPRTNRWANEWLATNQLPKLIRITLGFGRPNSYQIDPENIFTRTVSLESMLIPRAYQILAPTPGQPGMSNGPPGSITTGPPGMRRIGGDDFTQGFPPDGLPPNLGFPANVKPIQNNLGGGR